MAAEDAKGVLSLVEYARKQRRTDCVVCALSPEVRHQMLNASEKKIKRTVVLAWLEEVHGATITDGQLTAHYSGKHEQ